MHVGVEISLRDAIAGRLEDDGDSVDVKGGMFEEMPGDAARAFLMIIGSGVGSRCQVGRVRRDECDGENTASTRDGCPDSESRAKAMVVEKAAKEEGAY